MTCGIEQRWYNINQPQETFPKRFEADGSAELRGVLQEAQLFRRQVLAAVHLGLCGQLSLNACQFDAMLLWPA